MFFQHFVKSSGKKNQHYVYLMREISLDSWAAGWELSHLSYLSNWNCLMKNPHSITCPSEHPWCFCALRCSVWWIPPEHTEQQPRVPARAPHTDTEQLKLPIPECSTCSSWSHHFSSLRGSLWMKPSHSSCITLSNSRQEHPSNMKNSTLSDLPPEIVLPLQLGCASIFDSNKVHLPLKAWRKLFIWPNGYRQDNQGIIKSEWLDSFLTRCQYVWICPTCVDPDLLAS